jgi:hypothetical protein
MTDESVSQVIATYEQYEQSPYMHGLCSTTRSIVLESGLLIQAALDTLMPKYYANLKDGGTGNVFKDAAKKVEWLWEKDYVEGLDLTLVPPCFAHRPVSITCTSGGLLLS